MIDLLFVMRYESIDMSGIQIDGDGVLGDGLLQLGYLLFQGGNQKQELLLHPIYVLLGIVHMHVNM